MCGSVPVAATSNGRRPHQCDGCREKYAEAHRLAAETYRDRRKARGECVQCGTKVTQKSPRTGELYVRCAPCTTRMNQAGRAKRLRVAAVA